MNDKPKVYAFIDNQNLNMGVQKFGWKMDWRKFRKLLQDEFGVQKAFMFIGYMPENEDLYTQMHEAGYLVVLKPTLEMYAKPEAEKKPGDEKNEAKPEHVRPPTKGNTDAELVMYVMKELPNYDKAIIVSGDGDFYSIVEYLEQQGKLLHLMAPNWMYSSLMKPFEKYVVRVDSFKKQLAYRGFSKKPKTK